LIGRQLLLLLDGNNLLYRSFWAIKQPLKTSSGQPTGAVFGFTNTLKKIINNYDFKYIAVAFDRHEDTFRKKIYPEYKASRQAMPEELISQVPYIKRMTMALGAMSLEKPGFEADDIIATLSQMSLKQEIDVVIISGDKDLLQLVGPNIKVFDPLKNITFDEDAIHERFGVKSANILDMLALMGDKSDNIPGVPGIGPKTATGLIVKFGSIEELLSQTDRIKNIKQRERLNKYADMAILSKRLITLDTNVDLDVDIDSLEFTGPNIIELEKIYNELEFHKFKQELNKTTDNPGIINKDDKQPNNYTLVQDETGLKDMILSLRKAGRFAIDLETTSLDPIDAEIVGFAFSIKPHSGWYVPTGHIGPDAIKQLTIETVLKNLRPVLSDPAIKKVGQNIKYDISCLKKYNETILGIDFDTMIAAYLLEPDNRRYNLDRLCNIYLDRSKISYKEVTGQKNKQIGFEKVSMEKALQYAAEDADTTIHLYEVLSPLLSKNGLEPVNIKIEIPLIEVLAEMELCGIKIDPKMLGIMSDKISIEIESLSKKIYEIAGHPFNINSPKQLSEVLFEEIGLPIIKKTKTSQSTNVEVLNQLAMQHPLPETILEYRSLSKLKSTYLDALPKLIHHKTKRLHTSFHQTVAATGRLSSSEPNLQNIPIRTNHGKQIRKAFIAERNCLFLGADYSQIELRILAHFSKDPNFVDAFLKDEDIHKETASKIFNIPTGLVNQEMRRKAKTINFGIIYGMSSFRLSRELKVPPMEAKHFIDQYYERYKGIKSFMDIVIKEARENGLITTIGGRHRMLPNINSKNHNLRQLSERIAINSVIQGSAADIIKIAMINIYEHIKTSGANAKMILQIHDELIFELPEKELDPLKKLVKDKMEGAWKLNVPLTVDMAWGQNWAEIH